MDDMERRLEVVTEELRVANEEVRAQQQLIDGLVRERAAEHLAATRLAAALPIPVLETDGAGLVLHGNPAASSLLRIDAARLRGKPLTVLVGVADRRAVRSALARAIAHDRVQHLSVALTPRGESAVQVDAVVLPDTGAQVPSVPPSRPDSTGPPTPAGPAARWVLAPRTGSHPAGEPELLAALGAVSRLSVVDGDLRSVLTRVANLAVQGVAPAVSASLVAGSPTEPSVLVSTDEVALALEGAQHYCGQGPVWDAYVTSRPVTAANSGADPRWPRLGPLIPAGTDGIAAVPLADAASGGSAGVLTLYGTAELAEPRRIRQLELFAGAAAALLREHDALAGLRRKEAQLREALTSRAVIDQAKGVLMARHRLDADAAFAELARRSQHANVKLREVARQIVAGVSERGRLSGRSASAPERPGPAAARPVRAAES